MKNIKIFLVLFAAAATLGSCIKEEFPEDGSATKDQAEQSVTTLAAGLHAWMNKVDVTGNVDDGMHSDFGYGALMISREFMGQDFTHIPEYGQWDDWMNITGLGPDYAVTNLPWRWYYRMIFQANTILNLVPDPQSALTEERWAVGTAHFYRAMVYFDLVRLYLQGRYVGNEDGPTVPVITEATTIEQSRNNPRAKASDVYTLILSDLASAADLLEDYGRYDMISPDLAVIDGMYARVYLEMGDYGKAAEYAASARDGLTPLTETEWRSRQNGFNSPANGSWLWAFAETKNDEIVETGIVCWVGHMVNETEWGYAGAGGGCFTMIDAHLYSLMNDTDFRKNSWVDPREDRVIPMDSDFVGFGGYTAEELFDGYTSLKFRPGMGEWANYVTGNSVHVPLMRMEEMMMIEIEAAGRASVADGVAQLNDFVQTYRDPEYESTAATLDEFIEDLWIQRRIEFWGEGLSFFDIKRLNKGITRSYAGTNHPEAALFNTTEQPEWMNLVIPRNEYNSNSAITTANNNPTPATPMPSPEHVW